MNARGNDGSTPLMTACVVGNAGLVAALLAAGANPHIVNAAGESALSLACGCDMRDNPLTASWKWIQRVGKMSDAHGALRVQSRGQSHDQLADITDSIDVKSHILDATERATLWNAVDDDVTLGVVNDIYDCKDDGDTPGSSFSTPTNSSTPFQSSSTTSSSQSPSRVSRLTPLRLVSFPPPPRCWPLVVETLKKVDHVLQSDPLECIRVWLSRYLTLLCHCNDYVSSLLHGCVRMLLSFSYVSSPIAVTFLIHSTAADPRWC